MSVSVTRAEGVTVLTLNTDSSSVCPPLCQILHGLCYNPACCSVSQQLRNIQRSSPSLLGALHIMTGLLIIGLAVVLCVSYSGLWWYMDATGFPFWLGSVFVTFGIVSILSEKFPSPCLVIINAILQLSGICFSIAAIVLFSINMGQIDMWQYCRHDDYDYYNYNYRRHHTTMSPSPADKALMESCLEAKRLTLMLLQGIGGLLIVLSVLELCVTVSSSVLAIKALKKSGKSKSKSEAADLEAYKPLVA